MNHAVKTARYVESVTDQETIDSLRLLSGLQTQFAPPPAPNVEPVPEPTSADPADVWTIRFSAVREHPLGLLNQLPLAYIPATDWQQLRHTRDGLWEAQERNQEHGIPFSLIGLAGLSSALERWVVTAGLWASHWEWTGCRVLLLDADPVQAPSYQTPELAEGPGFLDVASRSASLSSALQRVQGTQLYLMGPGSADTAGLDPIDFRAIRPLLAELRRHFDFVFCHLPSHEGASDLPAWVRSTDGTMLTCRRNQDRYSDLERLLARLPQQKALGWVVL
jgi:hypothetical protein